jgi:hypothetical protein
MQKPYVAPELNVVGEAEDVVLGSGGAGSDLFAEDTWADMEFADDAETPEL